MFQKEIGILTTELGKSALMQCVWVHIQSVVVSGITKSQWKGKLTLLCAVKTSTSCIKTPSSLALRPWDLPQQPSPGLLYPGSPLFKWQIMEILI